MTEQPQLVLWDVRLFFGVTVGVLAVIFIGSAYKTNELSGGGSSVATLMGGRPVNPNTIDPDERKLLNVVEEMAIASGVPVPQVYVLNDENGHQRLCRRPYHRRCRHRRHARLHRIAVARPVAGRHRP